MIHNNVYLSLQLNISEVCYNNRFMLVFCCVFRVEHFCIEFLSLLSGFCQIRFQLHSLCFSPTRAPGSPSREASLPFCISSIDRSHGRDSCKGETLRSSITAPRSLVGTCRAAAGVQSWRLFCLLMAELGRYRELRRLPWQHCGRDAGGPWEASHAKV